MFLSYFPEDNPFVLQLLYDGIVVDAVQVGGDGTYGEGDPIPSNGASCFVRNSGVDTNDNLFDFLEVWTGTPGLVR